MPDSVVSRVQFAHEVAVVTRASHAPAAEHRSGVALPNRAELEQHIEFARQAQERINAHDDDNIGVGASERANRTLDCRVVALCAVCGRKTSRSTCICGADMREAIALWRQALCTAAVDTPGASSAPIAIASSLPIESGPPSIGSRCSPAARRQRHSPRPRPASKSPALMVPTDAAALEESLRQLIDAAMTPRVDDRPDGADLEAQVDALMSLLPAPLQPSAGSECAICLQLLVQDAAKIGADSSERFCVLPTASEMRDLAVLPCAHVFHRECLRTWWMQKHAQAEPCCLLCKRTVSRESLAEEWRSWIVKPASGRAAA